MTDEDLYLSTKQSWVLGTKKKDATGVLQKLGFSAKIEHLEF
jgi:hypothetical protein